MALLRRLYGRLHLTVNETKSAVVSVFGRKFLGYAFWVGPSGEVKRRVADKAIKAFNDCIRDLTPRVTGLSLQSVAERLRIFMLGKGFRRPQVAQDLMGAHDADTPCAPRTRRSARHAGKRPTQHINVKASRAMIPATDLAS